MYKKLISLALCAAMLMAIASTVVAANNEGATSPEVVFIDENSFMLDGVLFVVDVCEDEVQFVLELHYDDQILERNTVNMEEDWLKHENYRDAIMARDGSLIPAVQTRVISDYVTITPAEDDDYAVSADNYAAITPFASPTVTWIPMGVVTYQVSLTSSLCTRLWTYGLSFHVSGDSPYVSDEGTITIGLRAGNTVGVAVALLSAILGVVTFGTGLGAKIIAGVAGFITNLLGQHATYVFQSNRSIELRNTRRYEYNVRARDVSNLANFIITQGVVYRGSGQVDCSDTPGYLRRERMYIFTGLHPYFIENRDDSVAWTWFNLFWEGYEHSTMFARSIYRWSMNPAFYASRRVFLRTT